jgi:hypothetical protein
MFGQRKCRLHIRQRGPIAQDLRTLRQLAESVHRAVDHRHRQILEFLPTLAPSTASILEEQKRFYVIRWASHPDGSAQSTMLY